MVPDACIGFVEVNTACAVNTTFPGWKALHSDIKVKVMDIICEYAKTPIEERESKKAVVTFSDAWTTKDIHDFFEYAATLNETFREFEGLKIKENKKSLSYQIITGDEVA